MLPFNKPHMADHEAAYIQQARGCHTGQEVAHGWIATVVAVPSLAWRQ